MGVVNRPQHTFSNCVCGHAEHVGRAIASIGAWPKAACPSCEEMESAEHVTIAIEPLSRVAYLMIGEGSLVKCDGRPMRVLSAAEITKLNGRVHTGYVRLKLREAARR